MSFGARDFITYVPLALYYTRHQWDIPITAFTASYLQVSYRIVCFILEGTTT